MSQPLTLGIDVGGTSIKCSAIDPSGESRDVLRMPTPQDDTDGARTASAVRGLIERVRAAHDIAAIGLAVPGIVDEASGTVVSAVNLGWKDVGFRALIERSVNIPVAFGQDVRTGALAEARLGAARGYPVSVFLPIGTGVSIATVIDGVPLAGGGWAGELGQLPIGRPGEADRVSIESLASASAIAARTGSRTALDAAEKVRQGDPLAVRVWTEAIDALADALAWTVAVTGAGIVVVGGGLGSAGRLLLDPLEAGLSARLSTLRPPVVAGAAFADLSTMVGAGLIAHDLLR
ncbi:glucokinase [Cryobacterium mesophilum]|uniref:ROK family protein n=1 Tax=Terrimesophilobacter mesophilus TaxID=433647 RepID=A0A4R8VCQ9_9MICO|nr:ROK family protein [Terrimesophilobacter mesophilus]MBB5632821.1 glucokinase [Terrimesophilobacter mesophilus]TFB79607.1 ROK family protein [Terrimesophilobacter mesophilus]